MLLFIAVLVVFTAVQTTSWSSFAIAGSPPPHCCELEQPAGLKSSAATPNPLPPDGFPHPTQTPCSGGAVSRRVFLCRDQRLRSVSVERVPHLGGGGARGRAAAKGSRPSEGLSRETKRRMKGRTAKNGVGRTGTFPAAASHRKGRQPLKERERERATTTRDTTRADEASRRQRTVPFSSSFLSLCSLLAEIRI